MPEKVTGNLAGLKASEIKALERIYRRRVAPSQVVSPELATFMAELSGELHRQVGVLVDRRGAIEHVIVGDASKIVLPDVGRLRGAPGRFRGLRLVHTHLRGEALTRDDLTDLALLRLDAVAAITVDGGHAQRLYVGHLLPDGPADRPWRELPGESPHAPTTDFAELIASLEAEYGRGQRLAETGRGTRAAARPRRDRQGQERAVGGAHRRAEGAVPHRRRPAPGRAHPAARRGRPAATWSAGASSTTSSCARCSSAPRS